MPKSYCSVQKNGTASNRSRRPSMLRAAVCPWRSATTQCSTRMRSPVSRSGQRAMSPAAKMPGTLVSRYSSTVTPRSMARPACSASPMIGRTPMPTTTRSARRVSPCLQADALLVDGSGGGAEMERHAVLLVEFADELPDVRAQDLLHGNGFRRDHMHVDIARAQRCRHLEADEARADHHRSLRSQRLGDQGAAVGERAQIVHMSESRPGHVEPHRLGAGGEQQRIDRHGDCRPRAAPAGWRCRSRRRARPASGRCRAPGRTPASAADSTPRTQCPRGSPSKGWGGHRAPTRRRSAW